jgi:hypothetical protein
VRRETDSQRRAWTAYVEGTTAAAPPRASKYGNVRSGGFMSKYEESVAVKLEALESCGQITELQYQVPFTLVPGNGRVRKITYIADFTWKDLEGNLCIGDAKGYNKDKVYRLKKKLLTLMLGLEITEL